MKTNIYCCILFLVTFSQTSALTNPQLPPLVKRTYHTVAPRTINVTVGEPFSIPLPYFDSPWLSGNFRAYQTSEQNYKQHSVKSEQAKEEKQNQQEQAEIGMDYLPFDCTLVEGSATIAHEIKSIRQEYSRMKSSQWQQNSYAVVLSKSILYILNTGSSQLLAYMFNDHTIQKLTTYKLNGFIDRDQEAGEVTVSPPTIALDSKQASLYIFSSRGIWSVDTKTILTNVKQVKDISGFDSAQYAGVDKVIHGEMGMLVAIKRMDRVFLIPEASSDPSISYKYRQVLDFNGTKIFPQDIAIISNTLFVLDFYSGVYIFEILRQGQVLPRSFISITSFGGNYQIKVYHNTIFINFNDIDGSKVVEINADYAASTYDLVRFYKSQEFINKIKVFMVPTQYYLQPEQDRYNEESFESFLFLLENSDDLQIYPFNLDPRIINQAYNAVKLKGTQIRQFFHIASDRFLIITNERIEYLRLSIQRPAVACHTKKPASSSPQNYYMLKITSNLSTCEHKDHSQPLKKHFNEYCSMETEFYLHIGDPQESQHQKALLYGVVIGVIVCFVGGLLCLMQWRNNKMVILGRLKNEILNFRNRHKRIQPFVEENYEHKDIEIEVPKVEAVLQPE